MNSTNENIRDHMLSIVVPLYNEEENVEFLLGQICDAMLRYPYPWELVIVDDGSSDNTFKKLKGQVNKVPVRYCIVHLQRNFGQTAAMQAGIDHAHGDVIATLDGDLQNDPADIPLMVARLIQDDLDLLVGWRRTRKDNFILRTLPSRIANKLIGSITQVRLHDYGCSLKIYRASVIKSIRLYGEMHRFIPAWVATATAPNRVAEQVVNHRVRLHGTSKYGISRSFRVLLDLLSVYFFLRYRARPGHFFGTIGLVSGSLGFLALTYLAIVKFCFGQNIGTRPLLLVGVVLLISAIQFLTTGIIAEFMARTYFESSNATSYQIRMIVQNDPADKKTTDPDER